MDTTYSQIPVNLTQAGDELVLHAPMPGAEPEDILITIGENTITLHASPRGMLAVDKNMLRHEWRIGDYHRTIELSYPIDTARVNATYRNGVLTVTMPKSDSTTPREIRLDKLQSAYGETQGHSGQA